ncbi:MAG: Spy/CpxP family protein refolding chaperone [Bacillota bacterium]
MVSLKKRWVWAALALVVVVGIAGVAAAAPATGQVATTGGASRRLGGFGGMGGPGGACGFFGMAGFGAAGRGAGQPGQGVAGLIEKLNLTDGQIEQIRKINTETFEQIQPLRESVCEKMLELQNLCWQRDPDEDAIEAKQAEIAALREQMSDIGEQAGDDLENILTEEQQEALSQLKTSAPGKRFRMRGNAPAKAPEAGDAGTTSN